MAVYVSLLPTTSSVKAALGDLIKQQKRRLSETCVILKGQTCASWARIQADQGEENKCGGQEGLQDQDSGGGGAAGGRTRTCRHDGRRGLKSETVGWRTYQLHLTSAPPVTMERIGMRAGGRWYRRRTRRHCRISGSSMRNKRSASRCAQ